MIIKTMMLASALLVASTTHANPRTVHTSLVSENASIFTPGALDGRVEAIAVDGDTVYVGGDFTDIQMALDGEEFDQPYLFAYSKSTGAISTSFRPVLNKPVRALRVSNDGSLFVGGEFTIVNGETNRKGLVKLDANGQRVPNFSARPDKRVYTMDRVGDVLYIGGNFTRIGQTQIEYLAAIDVDTGDVLPNLNLDFEGVLSTTTTTGFPSVDDIEVTSDGSLAVVVGNFTSINGISRHRLAVIELDGQAMVSDWNTNVFDIQCPARKFPQYIKGIDISPDDSYFVTGTTGFRIIGNPACDSIARFDFGNLTDTDAQPTWVNYTGGDSVYEVAASDHAIYTGGHFRTLNNGLSRDGGRTGPGAVERRGLAALDPLNGLPILDWRSDRNPRGVGTFALEIYPEGMYIGDDTDFINGREAKKFKFLPITTNEIERPLMATLPTTIVAGQNGTLTTSSFDGNDIDNVASMPWETVKGSMMLDGQMFYVDGNGQMSVRTFDGNILGSKSPVDMYAITNTEWDLPSLTGMFFEHSQSRVYYTYQNDSTLYYRAFTPSGPLFGDIEYEADSQGNVPWNSVRGMDVIDGNLYYGHVNGNMYSIGINGSQIANNSPSLVSNNWDANAFAFSTDFSLPPTESQYQFEHSGSETFKSYKAFTFPVQQGTETTIRLTWVNESAHVNVFLRDSDNNLVDSDVTVAEDGVKWLTAPAGVGGVYKVAVKIQSGNTSLVIDVNPMDETPPEPLADFVFDATGSVTQGRWQVFKFDVEAGQQIDSRVLWNDSDTTMKVFLRDETNTQVDNDVSLSGSPIDLSTVATSSGRWSLAVRIEEGETDYTVLIDTQ